MTGARKPCTIRFVSKRVYGEAVHLGVHDSFQTSAP